MAQAAELVRSWRLRLIAAPVAVGAVAAVAVLTGGSSASATYRTASVESGDVTQTLTATGAIASATQEDLAFQVDGTVAKVKVAEGDTVEAGDVLARLDTSDLEDAVAEAEEALADAKEALADDLEAQSSATSSTTTAESASYSSDSGSGSGSGSDSGVTAATVVSAVYVPADTRIVQAAEDTSADAVEAARAALLAAQQALLDQYDVAQALLETAQQAAADAQEICTAFTAADESTDDGSDDGVDDAADDASDDAGATDAAEALAACQEATAAALAASQESIEAQASLMELATAVDEAVAALQDAIAASGDAGGTGGDGSGDSSGGTGDSSRATGSQGGDAGMPGDDAAQSQDGSSGAVGGLDGTSGLDDATGSLGGSSDDGSDDQSQDAMSGGSAQEETVPSAADILADKAEITAARAALKVAQQQVEYAVLRAPVAGTIVAVGMDEDGTVSAGDTTAAITLVADNSYLVELSVSLTEAQLLEVGQEAELTLSSSGDVVDGVVSSVSNVNSGNDFSQSYAVTIAVPDPGFSIRIGAATRMTITVAGASGVLVVPTSAVADAAGDATVQVIGEDGLATDVAVETGAIGAVYTEIASGLEDGDEVILADLTADLTSDDEEASDGSGGLLSGLSSDDESSEGPQMGQMPGGGMQQGGGMAPPGFSG
ncbi:efflux RND transporter periplasmic adaptor subunit [Demequina rhizosphaerae]|uniref:efflux RND transporter periplasmic adaptor subunit n=1 Tax=Demequina rhizosphaerae TaxID=1638985 RepID=UPI000784DE14|nr:efflux RND transporter periplasmic adaptor subunit [Demequina rhizosphaerae]